MYILNIMKPEKYSAKTIESLLKKRKIATLPELKTALNTSVAMTVYRKLQELAYLKSYSDRGKYYTLKDIAAFDEQGLWVYQSARFSRDGTLIDTIERFINVSDEGHFEGELEEALGVCVRVPLLKLFKAQRIKREKLSGCYLYHSVIPEVGMRQIRLRKETEEELFIGIESTGRELLHHELKAAIILFYSVLDEKQRRLYAGLESLMCGYGGDTKVADLLNINEHTVARGRSEILQRDIEIERVRRQGGGRKDKEKKHRKS